MAEDPVFERSTPVLMADDYERSRSFFRDLLGFEVIEEGGDPPRFGIFRRGHAFLFVDAWHGAAPARPERWNAYVHVNDVDALAGQLRGAGATLSRDPENTVYGMRECEVTDPDGNVICFGADLPNG